MKRSLSHKLVLSASIFALLFSLNLFHNALADSTDKAAPSTTNKQPKLTELALAQQKSSAYAEKYNVWLQGQNQSFEPLLIQGQAAAKAILAVANDLDEDAFNEFRAKMPGFLFFRDNIIAIVPDAVTLAEQSKSHGQPQDVAFFKGMAQTLNGYWPVTQEQLNDLSGCSRFGSHDLVKLYGTWKTFQKQYPKAYAFALNDPGLLLLADIEDQLLNSPLACDGPDTVNDELETFIKTYPTSDLTPKLKKRLEEIRQNKSGMKFFQGIRYLEPKTEEEE